jgi:hypothetical protein
MLPRLLRAQAVSKPALTVALAFVLIIAAAGPAVAHAVGWTIWGYGFDITSNTDNHYHVQPFCTGSCPYDYYLSTNTTVHQDYAGEGDFVWRYLNLPGGGVLNPNGGSAYYGHNTWIFDGAGGSHPIGDNFCNPINWSISMPADRWNLGSTGYWTQDSGYTSGTNCFYAYEDTDRMVIFAGQ